MNHSFIYLFVVFIESDEMRSKECDRQTHRTHSIVEQSRWIRLKSNQHQIKYALLKGKKTVQNSSK